MYSLKLDSPTSSLPTKSCDKVNCENKIMSFLPAFLILGKLAKIPNKNFGAYLILRGLPAA